MNRPVGLYIDRQTDLELGARTGSRVKDALLLDSYKKLDLTEAPPEGLDLPGGGSSDTRRATSAAALRESLLTILSGQYGLLLVVVGAVLPVVETFADPNSYMFEGFYIYLYVVSFLFLTYVYAYLLRKQATFMPFKRAFSSMRLNFRRTTSASGFSRSGSCRSVEGGTADASGAPPGGGGGATVRLKYKRRRVAYKDQPNNHTGSFYLRVGAIGFGIGSMIHSGLTFGHYFEIVHIGSACSDVIQAVKPFLHLVFTFVQMYFIFMNSKMCIKRLRAVARFGLMHMAGTNICVWLRAIVVETVHEIVKSSRNHTATPLHFPPVSSSASSSASMSSSSSSSLSSSSSSAHNQHAPGKVEITPLATNAVKGLLPELQCQYDALMGRVLESSTSYLYPCIIEYSLICASVLYVMWDQVGHDPRRRHKLPRLASVADMPSPSPSAPGTPTSPTTFKDDDDDDDDDLIPAMKRMSVDCSGSQRGLFMGLFLFVSAVVALVVFYVLTGDPSTVPAASMLSHVAETLIYVLSLAATLTAAWRMKHMRYCENQAVGVEQTLVLISLTGLIAFGMFNIVAAIFSPGGPIMAVTLMSNIIMLLQACAQALFLLAAMRATPGSAEDVRRKPGRQWVTFLLVCNFTLWGINTFETQRTEHNLLQVEFYGSTAWNIFCHVSVPLGIYFRFHSTVCLSNIWKNAWKSRKHH